MLREIIEATLSQIANKQKSITMRFPDFFSNSVKVPGIIAKGGLRMTDMGKDTWSFKVHSGSEEGKWYEVTLRWKNVVPEVQRVVADRRNWNKAKTKVDLKKAAAQLFKKLDVELLCECLTGDTKIYLLDGRILTIEEILSEFGTEKPFWVYASDENGDLVPAKATCLGKTKDVNQLVEVVLDNDEKVKCTPEHPFRMRDGSYRQAEQLIAGDSLMPCYIKQTEPNSRFSQRYNKVVLNSRRGSDGRPIWKTIYRVVAESLLKKEYNDKLIEVGGEDKVLVVHHKNMNSLNDCPENLQWLEIQEHWELHAKNHQNATAAILRAWEDPEWSEKMRESNRKASKICKEKHPEMVTNFIVAGINFMRSKEGQKRLSERSNKQWLENREKIVASMQGATSEEECKSRSERKKSWWAAHPEARKAQGRRIAKIRKETVLRDSKTGRFYNHRVVSVNFIDLEEAIPVYDLSVENYQNFALAAGIFVHNCPADLYYGGHYIRSQDKYRAKYGEPENRSPDIRNPKQYGAFCKHIQALFKTLPWYKSTMANWLKKNYEEVIKREEDKAAKRAGKYAGLGKALGKRKAKESIQETSDLASEETMQALGEIKNEEEYYIVNSFLDREEGETQYPYSWPVMPAARVIKIWNDYAKLGFVRDEEGIDKLADIVHHVIMRLGVNTELSGHSSYDPSEFFKENGIDEEQFLDWSVDEDGQYILSDYAWKGLTPLNLSLYEAETPEEKLQFIDRILNVVHQRGDLSKFFIEGGRETLDNLASYQKKAKESIEEARNRRDKCMECSAKPEVECLWAEGRARAWLCMKHFKKWATEGDGRGDVCAVKKIQDGKASVNWGDNTSPNIIKDMKFLKESIQEAVATLSKSQQKVKSFYKDEPKELKTSTFPGERWYKFWLLTDGTIIPVIYAHDKTLRIVGGVCPGNLLEDGVIRGAIIDSEFNIEGEKPITKEQKSSLINLALKHKVRKIYVDLRGKTAILRTIKSSDQLDYVLTYGPEEAWESKKKVKK